MKRFMRAAIITAVIALVLPWFAWATKKEPGSRQTPPKVTALVCSFNPGDAQWPPEPHVYVVGGCVAGKGWIEGGKATGLLHKGDRLSLCALETSSLGHVVLTSSDGGKGGYGGITVLAFPVKVRIPPQKKAAYAKARKHRLYMLAAWNPQGRAPRWITGRILDKDSSRYRKVIADWLRRRGIPEDVINKVVIEQVVLADINRDGHNETFLSFYTAGMAPEAFEPPSKRTFSYLIMRYRPPRSRDPKTVVVQYDTLVHDVAGFCDLDGDGWAEVITGSDTGESGGDDLHHWVGDRFETLKGWRAGV